MFRKKKPDNNNKDNGGRGRSVSPQPAPRGRGSQREPSERIGGRSLSPTPPAPALNRRISEDSMIYPWEVNDEEDMYDRPDPSARTMNNNNDSFRAHNDSFNNAVNQGVKYALGDLVEEENEEDDIMEEEQRAPPLPATTRPAGPRVVVRPTKKTEEETAAAPAEEVGAYCVRAAQPSRRASTTQQQQQEQLVNNSSHHQEPVPDYSTHVVIVGGGAVALLTALQLLEYGKRRDVEFSITIVEEQWIADETDGYVQWSEHREYSHERWQVATLQSSVWFRLPFEVQCQIFHTDGQADFVELWPYGPDSPKEVGSPRNISIRTLEDKLLDLLQQDPYYHYVQLVVGAAVEEDFHNVDFVILTNKEGTAPGIPDFAEAVPFAEDPEMQLSETILGIYVDGDAEAEGATVISESESMALTVSQNRYLLNPLGRQLGFLHMWLSRDEEKELCQEATTTCEGSMMFRQENGTFECPKHQGTITTTFWPRREGSLLGQGIEDGLRLYGMEEDAVVAFTTLKVGPFSKRTNFMAPLAVGDNAMVVNSNPRQPMVFVVGDAAMQVHLRGGRSLNAGIKGAVTLARCLTNAAERGTWRWANFVDYGSFMFALQEREVRIRTMAMMQMWNEMDTETTDTSIIGRITTGQQQQPPGGDSRERLMERVERMAKGAFPADRLPAGMSPPRIDVLQQAILQDASDSLVGILEKSLEWNTREAGGWEVNPDMYIEEPQDLNGRASQVATTSPRAASSRPVATRAAPQQKAAPAPAVNNNNFGAPRTNTMAEC